MIAESCLRGVERVGATTVRGTDFATSRSVGQSLADDPKECFVGPLHVIHAEPNPARVTEIELGDVAMKVPFAAVPNYSKRP